ncbi:MAG: cobalamin-dependent protein [Oscillospiraceae bacterium]|nr:cobalamin-dependent protein [Oscillospiraceae bacterium]
MGVDVPPERFVEAAINEKCDLVLCSALLTTTMPMIQKVIEALSDVGIRDQVTVMIGGAPVTEEFGREIGADYYTEDAAACANKAEEILKAKAGVS